MVDASKKKKKKTESKNDLVPNMYQEDEYDDENLPTEYDRKTAATWVDHLLLNRPLKAILAMLIVAIIVPTLLYAYMYGVTPQPDPFGTCVILPEFWSECMPGIAVNTSRQCKNTNCCWNSTLNYCYHTLPAQHSYKILNQDADIETTPVDLKSRYDKSPLGNENYPLSMRISAVTLAHAIVQFSNEEPEEPPNTIPMDESQIEAKFKNGEGFWLSLIRRDNPRETLFTTENGPLIASDGFWEISLQFPSDAAVFGAGSAARKSLRIKTGNSSLYSGSLGASNGRPFLLCLHKSNKSHGVLFESPGALEVVSRISNLVTIRSTANNKLNLHVFTGDTPAQVIERLTDFIGRPSLIPNWALGLHVCRDAARNDTLESVEMFRNASIKLNFPYDSDCVDDSALGVNSLDPENDKRLEDLKRDINIIKGDGRHFIFSLFPHITNGSIAYDNAEGLLITFNESEPYLGWHRDLLVAFPDYTAQQTATWLKEQLQRVLGDLWQASLAPSGLALPDNWPLNDEELQDDGELSPIFVPEGLEGSLSNGTIWWLAQHVDGTLHHARHAEYGAAHSRQAFQAFEDLHPIPDRRLPVFSASKWTVNAAGSWLGDDQPATWDGLKGSLLTVLEAGISGEPFSGGGSVCGSSGEWSESLCTRWSILAMAAFPIVRYHHVWEEPPRDPSFINGTAAGLVARAIRLRYQLSPYLYTQMYIASQTGMPVTRAMAIDFYTDSSTWALDEQFMVGPSLMLAPILKPADVAVKVYLPNPPTTWYHLLDGEPVVIANNTGEITILVGENELIMLQRGGHVIVMQEPGTNMADTQISPMSFYAALHCENSADECFARGELYIDDGVSIMSPNTTVEIIATSTSLSISELDPSSPEVTTCPGILEPGQGFTISDIVVYGLPGTQEGDVFIDGKLVSPELVDFSAVFSRLRILKLTDVEWCVGKTIDIEWTLNIPEDITSTTKQTN